MTMTALNLNSLDVLLLLVLMLGATYASLQGITRLLISVFCLYLSLVLALLLYLPLANFLQRLIPAFSVVGSQALAFAFILFTVFNATNFLTRFATPSEEERRRRTTPLPDTLSDMSARALLQRFVVGPLAIMVSFAIGLLISVATLSLIMAVVQHILVTDAAVGGGIMRQNLRTSALLPMFNSVLLTLYRAVDIWLPSSDVPAIFDQILKYRP
jgi:uncharacterized membrane protein required for colicin V production